MGDSIRSASSLWNSRTLARNLLVFISVSTVALFLWSTEITHRPSKREDVVPDINTHSRTNTENNGPYQNQMYMQSVRKFAFAQSDTYHNGSQSAPWRPVRSILIFTTKRTGSSFIGEILARNQDVFYMFEPIKLLALDLKGYQSIQQNGTYYLDQILKCNLKEIIETSREAYKGDLFDAWFHRVFCGNMSRKECKKQTWSSLETRCRSKKYVVVKEIILKRIEGVKSLLGQGRHVIHLFRDPRGIMSSYIKLKLLNTSDTLRTKCEEICSRFSDQLDFASTHLIGKFDNYRAFRYEDFAINPTRGAEVMYSYLSMAFPKQVASWVKKATSADTQIKKAFSTSRDSRAAASAWRTHLKWPQVKFIQESCVDVLINLGYNVFQNEADFNNGNLKAVLKPTIFIE